MTIFYVEIRSNAVQKLYKALNHLLSENAPFSQIKRLPLFAAAFLSFAGLARPAAAQVNITYGGPNTISNYTIAYAVTFTTGQTGLSASNFSVTGTATGAYVSSVTPGSGTSWSVYVTVPNSFQSSGTVILNMVNSTGVSPGVSGLPVASPTVNDVLYPLTGSMTLTSSNANPGYAKSGDMIYVVVRSDYYGITQINGTVDNQIFNGSGSGSSGDSYVTLGAGAPQGPLTYAWQFVTSFSTNGNGSGTSSIVYDSQAPTVNISAPSVGIVAGNGTSSISYAVTYADANFNTCNLSASGITLNKTGTATGTVGVTGSGTTYTVTVSNITGAGTLGISVGAGYASDMAGNVDTGAGPSSTTTVLANVSPSISYAGPQVYPINTAISPLTPVAAINISVFGNTVAGTGLALDYNGNAYIISSSSEIIQYKSGNATAFPLPANSSANIATAAFSATASTIIFPFNGSFRAMDINNGAIGPSVTICPTSGTGNLVAATHPASGPEIVLINKGSDPGGQITFLTRTAGTWSSPAIITNAIPGSAMAINNYAGGVKLAYIGTDNNLYYSTYSGGTWSAVSPWGAPNISLSGVTAFALDAQGNVWYANGASLNELFSGSITPVTVATLPSAPNALAFDITGNLYANLGTTIVQLTLINNFQVSPALPAGLSINRATGVISGTPTAVSSAATYTVTATAGSGTLSTSVNIQTLTTPTLSYSGAVNATVGTNITAITPASTSVLPQKYNSTPTVFASVTAPTGITVDAAGNVYVADNSNNIDKFTPGSVTPTSLGSGLGPLATDVTGNFYFTHLNPSAYQFDVIAPGSTTVAYSGPVITAPVDINSCTGIAVDAAGNAYVSTNNANESVIEYTDGSPINAQGQPFVIGNGFSSVSGTATDPAGNIYVSDAGAGKIDLIPASRAQWTTLASGLGAPTNICIDGAGNLYYSDNIANTISELPAGSTTPVLIASGLGTIKALAVDGKGNLYAADYTNNVIDRFNPTGGYYINPILPPGLNFNGSTGVISGTPTATTTAGAAVTYTVTAYNTLGSVSAVQSLAVIAAPPVIAYGNARTFIVGKAIAPVTPASTGVAAQGYNPVPGFMDFQFGAPFAVAVDTSLNVYVADPYDFKIFAVSGASDPGGFRGDVFFVKGKGQYKAPATGNYQLNPLNCVATDSTGHVFFSSFSAAPAEYAPLPTLSSDVIQSYGYANTTCISTDPQGNLFGTISANGTVLQLIGSTPITVASGFTAPTGITIDGLGNMFVGDRGNNTLYKIPAGSSTKIAVATGFNAPYQLAADATGNIFIGDGGNGAVKELPAGGGPVITVIPNLKTPNGVAVDVKGALYVADAGFAQVRKYTPSGGYYISPSLPAGLSFDNSTGVISGTPTVITPIKDYKITAYNASGSTQTTLRFGVTPPSSNLSTLVLSAGSLSPAFATATTGYSVATPYSVSQTTVTSTAVDGNATITVNGAVVASGSASAPINLAVGANTITIVVKASDNSSTKTYTVTVNRAAASSNATLSNVGIGYVMVGGNEEAVVTPSATDPNATITVNGVAVATGTASNPIPLAPGSNTINITVTAQNGVTKLTYKITVQGPLSGVSSLSSLTISAGTLSPAFSGSTTNYTDNVTNTISSVTVTPTTTDANATVTVNAAPVTSGIASGAIALAVGNTIISTVVTAQDGVTTTTYTITVTRALSANASLTTLGSSIAPLSPAFTPNTTSYTLSVPNTTTSMTVKPVTSDANATLKVNGTALASGTMSSPISLAVGANTISVVVTAQNGTIKTYTITVTRAGAPNANLASMNPQYGPLSPVFSTNTTSYTESLANSKATMTVAPVTSDPNATIKVNGTALASGATSAPIPLAEGTTTTINVVVTAQDGVTTKTYSIVVTRGPSSVGTLADLSLSSGILSPTFATATASYTAGEINSVSSITVTPTGTDANAAITVNGVAVVSGAASGAIALTEGGTTNITVIVTSQDGTATKTYTVAVSRAPSSDATLVSMNPSVGPMSPAFYTNTTSYTLNVVNSKTSITVAPVSTDANATIKVNGTVLSSGTTSAPITLAEGAITNVSVSVTSQDGTATKTYTIAVTRAPSSDASLASMNPQYGPLSPVFNTNTTSYTESLANTKTSMTVAPVTTDANAKMTVNGTALASGSTSAPVALAVGSNTITVVVTAQDGTTKRTYTITVTRASGGADAYGPVSVSQPERIVTLVNDELKVHQGISPNGDGIEDFLQIDNISQYPDNKLSIMNRNGQLVFEAKGYDNQSHIFDGHSNKTGKMQLPGTYFFQLDYTVNGITKHKTGFIVLKY